MSRQAGSMFGGIQSRAGYPSKRAGSRCGCVLRARPKVKVGGNWHGLIPEPFWLPLYRHPRSNLLLARLGLSGLSPPMRQPGRRNGYRILLALPFALCSAADLNISLTLSEQDLTLPGAVRVIERRSHAKVGRDNSRTCLLSLERRWSTGGQGGCLLAECSTGCSGDVTGKLKQQLCHQGAHGSGIGHDEAR